MAVTTHINANLVIVSDSRTIGAKMPLTVSSGDRGQWFVYQAKAGRHGEMVHHVHEYMSKADAVRGAEIIANER